MGEKPTIGLTLFLFSATEGFKVDLINSVVAKYRDAFVFIE